MRRCSFSTVAYYRPTTARPSHRSHSRSAQLLCFFICGRWDPSAVTEKEGEKELSETLSRPTFNGCQNGSSSTQHVHMYLLHCTHTRTRTQVMYMAQGSVRPAVHREAYTVSQSTSPSDPFRGLPGGVLRQQLARQSRIDVQRLRLPLGSSLRACA